MSIQRSIKEFEGKLKAEVEQRLCAQKEARDTENMAKLLEEDYEQLHLELEEEKRSRAKLKRELEEANHQNQKQADAKELELINNQALLAEAKDRVNELNDEVEEKIKHIENQKLKIDATQSKYGDMKNKLEVEVQDEQRKLVEEMQVLKESKQQLEGRLQAETEQQAKLRRQQWWMTALQLRVKKIVMSQIEKEKEEAAKLRSDL